MTFGHSRAVRLLLPALALCAGLLSCTEEIKPLNTDPDVAFKRGTEMLDDNKYEDARKEFNDAKSLDTSKRVAPLAQLKIAESYVKEEDFEMGATEYKKFIDQYPENQYAPYAQYQAALAYFSEIQGSERGAGAAKNALTEFQKLKNNYPRNPYKNEVETYIRKCRDIIAEYEFMVGRFYFKKDSYEAATGRFTVVVTQYPDFKALEDVLYFLTLSLNRSGFVDKANGTFQKLKAQYPESTYIDELSAELRLNEK